MEEKKLNLFDLVSIGVGCIIGSGIFALMGVGISYSGRGITLALFLLIYLFLIIGWARIVIHLIKVGPRIDEGDGAGKKTARKAGNNSNGNVGASIGKAGE